MNRKERRARREPLRKRRISRRPLKGGVPELGERVLWFPAGQKGPRDREGVLADVVFRWPKGRERPLDPMPDFEKGRIHVQVVEHDHDCPGGGDEMTSEEAWKKCGCDPDIWLLRLVQMDPYPRNDSGGPKAP